MHGKMRAHAAAADHRLQSMVLAAERAAATATGPVAQFLLQCPRDFRCKMLTAVPGMVAAAKDVLVECLGVRPKGR